MIHALVAALGFTMPLLVGLPASAQEDHGGGHAAQQGQGEHVTREDGQAPAPKDVVRGYSALQQRIDRAPAGSVVRVETGRFEGPIVIDKPLILRGSGRTVVDGGGEGTVIRITASDVEVRGLVVRGTGTSLDREDTGIAVDGPRARIVDNRLEDVLFGIYLRRAEDSIVADNIIGSKQIDVAARGDAIRLWESSGSLIEGNRVSASRDVVLWFSDGTVLRDNRIESGRYGLHFMFSDDVHIEGNVMRGNSVGAFLMYSVGITLHDNEFAGNRGPSGYGIGLKDMDHVEATRNVVVGNRVGIYLDNSPASYNVVQHFRDNHIVRNDVGVQLLPAVERNVFEGNALIDNIEQVGIRGGGRTAGNVWDGNRYSDYAGFDADGDGVGDVPYRLNELFSTLADRHPELDFFTGTAAWSAIDLAADAFPAFRPEPKVVDEAPRLRVHVPTIATEATEGSQLVPSLAMILAASIVLFGCGAIRLPFHARTTVEVTG